jgi:putative hydrolase of the HAD superfamily
MRIKTLVFDFGNVIGFFDHRIVVARLARLASLPPETIRKWLLTDELEDAYESGRLSTAELLQYGRRTCGFRCTDEELMQAIADMFRRNDALCDHLPQLNERHRLLLLSNTNEIHSNHFRRQFADDLRHFDAMVLSHEVGIRKPHPGIYAHCLKLADCEPSECVFIDDLPVNIEAARACGWRGIVYSEFEGLRRELTKLGVWA